MFTIYNRLSHIIEKISRPILRFNKDPIIREKTGLLNRPELPKGPYDILIHAVSVGEMGVAHAVVNALRKIRPELRICASVSTKTGFKRAMETVGLHYPVFYYPFDFPTSVKNFLSYVQPRVYATVETEIWPNFFYLAKKNNTKIAIINGRISRRSYKNYLRIKGTISEVLGLIDGICVISEKFKERFVSLGVNENLIKISGNAKYESLLSMPSQEKANNISQKLNIPLGTNVFTFGSIRTEEAGLVVEMAMKLKERIKDLVIIIVPRHIQNLSIFEKFLKKHNLSFQIFSNLINGDKRTHNIILVDVIGPLFDIYGISTASFVGGTLIPVGGHNIMEPASWGCPVIFGKYIDNVEDAANELLNNQGGILVNDRDEFIFNALTLLNNKELTKRMGENARKSLEILGKNSATSQAEFLIDLLDRV